MTWRQRSAEVIARVRAAYPTVTGEELRKLLRDAYPFGPREHHPYKAWLAEVRRACGPASAPAIPCGACAGRGWVNEDGQGKAQRARAGEKLDFHARLKVGLFQAFSALQKDAKRNESPYFRRLVEYKHRLQTGGRYDEATNTFDGRKGGKAIVHNMAWRPAAQLLIEHLYIVWRTLEGLPVWPSYEAVKLGYGHGGKVVVNAPKMLTLDEALAVVGMAPVAADVAAE